MRELATKNRDDAAWKFDRFNSMSVASRWRWRFFAIVAIAAALQTPEHSSDNKDTAEHASNTTAATAKNPREIALRCDGTFSPLNVAGLYVPLCDAFALLTIKLVRRLHRLRLYPCSMESKWMMRIRRVWAMREFAAVRENPEKPENVLSVVQSWYDWRWFVFNSHWIIIGMLSSRIIAAVSILSSDHFNFSSAPSLCSTLLENWFLLVFVICFHPFLALIALDEALSPRLQIAAYALLCVWVKHTQI